MLCVLEQACAVEDVQLLGQAAVLVGHHPLEVLHQGELLGHLGHRDDAEIPVL